MHYVSTMFLIIISMAFVQQLQFQKILFNKIKKLLKKRQEFTCFFFILTIGDRMKKFKAKKRNRYFRLIVGFIITFFVFCLTISFLSKIKLTSSNEEFINAMLNDSNHHVLYDQQKNNYFGKFLKYLLNLDLKNPQTILNSVFQYKSKEESNDADEEKDEHLTDYISDPDSISVSDPVVYIYNNPKL